MNRKGYLMPILLTVLALAIGYLMPQAVSTIQDRRAHALSESLETDNVTLNFGPEMSVGQKMELAAQGIQYNVEIDSGKNMGAAEAQDCFQAMLQKMTAYGVVFDTDSYQTYSLYPYLEVFNDEASTSMIVWCLSAQDANGTYISLTIDDETGSLLSFCYSCGDVQVDTLGVAYALAGFINNEYGFYSYNMNPTYAPTPQPDYGDYAEYEAIGDESYVLSFICDDGSLYKTSLVFGETYMYFNF